jgi:RNA polymerase sigma factor (TIGR02999 family)
MTESNEITGLLKAWSAGDRDALNRLMPFVHSELRRLAERYLRRERPGHSLQTTALINEAYLRLVTVGELDWKDRAHFFAVAAQLMRRIIVDAARTRLAIKRGGQGQRVAHSSAFNFDEIADASSQQVEQLIALDDALGTLSRLDPRKVEVVEMRFFGGLSVEETAVVLGVSPQTVMRDWKLARAWLMRELAS